MKNDVMDGRDGREREDGKCCVSHYPTARDIGLWTMGYGLVFINELFHGPHKFI